MSKFEIHTISDPRMGKIIRCAISHVSDVAGYTDAECRSLTLAVDEAISNIIEHAYQWQTDQPIHVSCEIKKDRLEIILKDFGKKTDPSHMKPRDLSQVRPGGLGMHFIKSCMDIVNYQPTNTENQLLLAKYLPGSREENVES